MRKSLRSLLVIAAFAALSSSDLLACGDKYLSVGRGSRFQRGYVSLHPVTIAVLKSQVAGRKDFLSRLKVAGHRLEVTEDVAGLEALLKSGKYDVVLADYESAATVDRVLGTLTSKPLFLPVVDASSGVSKNAEKEYGCLLNAEKNKKRKNFLAVIDEAVDAKLKAKPVVCDLSKM